MYGLLSTAINDKISPFIENIKGIVDNFKWQDALDIIILGVLFYFVFNFFQPSNMTSETFQNILV